MESLPHSGGFPNEFVIAREQRSGYDHAVRAAGARLVEVGFNEIVSGAGVRRTEPWEYEAAFGPNTVGVLYVFTNDSEPPLSEVVTTAHKHGLSVLVGAAAELPPRSNLIDIPATGADLVAFSGGKSIRGPRSTGILTGRRELVGPASIAACAVAMAWLSSIGPIRPSSSMAPKQMADTSGPSLPSCFIRIGSPALCSSKSSSPIPTSTYPPIISRCI